MNYSKTKLKKIWEKAPECDCNSDDCHSNNHRLCYLCNEIILFGAYWQPNSKYRWDVDHVKPKSKNGNNNISNLMPCCIYCNRKKGNK